jgi:hypothetical protein
MSKGGEFGSKEVQQRTLPLRRESDIECCECVYVCVNVCVCDIVRMCVCVSMRV